MDARQSVNAVIKTHGRALIVLLTFATYADTFRFNFVYDDYPQIVVNPRLTSWHYLGQFFTTDVWSHFFSNAAIHYYRPIFSTWLLINHTLFAKHPLGWHVSNVVLHLIATVLVWILAERLTNDSTVAFFAGLLFGLHPIHGEVVAWVSTSSEMLLTIFVLSSLLCLLKLKSTGNPILCLAGSLMFYAAALLTKETAIVMPAAVFLIAWFYVPEQSHKNRLITSLKFAVPFFVFAGAYWLLRTLVLKNESYTLPPVSLGAMVLTWPLLLWRYLKLLVFPIGLSEFYEFTSVNSLSFRDVLLPLLFLFIVVVLLVWCWQRSHLKLIPMASIWILLWLAPVMYIRALQPGEILHDRYLYLPSVGFCLLVGAALTKILADGEESNANIRTPLAAAALTIILMSVNVSEHRFWRDDVALYERGVRATPGNSKVKLNLANALADRGRFEEAVPIYLKLLDDPAHQWALLYNLGYSYYQLGKLQDAQSYLEKAITLDPSNADEHKYAGLTQAKLGRGAVAEEHLKAAIRLKPQAVGYHRALAEFYEQQGRTQDALAEFRAELSLRPEDSELKSHVEQLEHSFSAHPTDPKRK